MSEERRSNSGGIKISVTSVPFAGVESVAAVKDSVFHVTLNTNTRIDVPDSEIEPYVKGLQDAANLLFGDVEYMKRIVKFPYAEDNGEFDSNHILAVDTTTRVEIGKDDAHGKRLHLHVIFKLTHKSRIHLVFHKVKSEMNSILAEKEYPHRIHYVHVEVFNDRGQRLRRYLHKT